MVKLIFSTSVGGDYVPSFIHLQHPCNSKRSTSRCDMSVAVTDENPNL